MLNLCELARARVNGLLLVPSSQVSASSLLPLSTGSIFPSSPRFFVLFLQQILPANPTHPLTLSVPLLHPPALRQFHRTLLGFYSLIRFASRCRFISPSFFLNFFSLPFTISLSAFPSCSRPTYLFSPPSTFLLPLDNPVLAILVLILSHSRSFSFVFYRTISFTYTVQFPVHARLARIFHISFKKPSLLRPPRRRCTKDSKIRRRRRYSETSFLSRFPSYQHFRQPR